jgi:cysteine desulfurase
MIQPRRMNESRLWYLDNNATTRVAPEVIEAMLPYFRENWGNPSSAYSFGHHLTKSIDEARANVSALVNAEPREIVFTSCGTESNNTAIQSALVTRPGKKHVVTTAVEHSATLKFCEFLRKQSVEVTFLPVNPDGDLDLHLLRQAIRSETALVSAMWANNETGVLFPVAEIAAICREKGVLFHTDAVQAAGKLKIDLKEVGADFVSFSAHKLYAPKGIGALYIKRHTRFQPYLLGGGQERGRRGGTENVPYIVAFGRAAELALARVNDQQTRVRALRDRLEQEVLRLIPGTAVNGSAQNRLPNTSNIAFEGIEAEGVLMLLDQAGVCASSGSACTTGSLDPSHVLVAMGCSAARARASVRFSFGIYNTDSDVDHVLDVLPGIIEKLRLHAPVQD